MNPRYIPAAWVSAGYGVPDVCATHGAPTADRRPIRISSTAPGWTYFLIPFGLAAFFIAVYATRKTVASPGWPFCAQCVHLHNRRVRVGFGLLAPAIVGFVAFPALGAALPNESAGSAVTMIGVLLAIAALTVGLIMLTRARWSSIAATQLTQDGAWVLVAFPAPAFDAQALAALSSAYRLPAEADARP